MVTASGTAQSGYPVTFDVEYPDRPLDRLSTAFRLIWIIPIAIVLGLVSESAGLWSNSRGGGSWGDAGGPYWTGLSIGGVLFGATVLMILFRQKYPRWWFDWNLELLRFSSRVSSYLFLLRDEYPSTDEHQAVHLDIRYPNAQTELNRFLPIVKWLLAIPHYIVLFFLWIGVLVAVIVAWFAILFTGTYPRGLFDFVVGVMRWHYRVVGYSAMLTTDAYPPFSLAP
jgi:hypothetical protein